jgi:hypothetical protein
MVTRGPRVGGVAPALHRLRMAPHRVSMAPGMNRVTRRGAASGMMSGLAVAGVRASSPDVARLHRMGDVAMVRYPRRGDVACAVGDSRHLMPRDLAHPFGHAAILSGIFAGAVFRGRRADLGGGGDRNCAEQGCD